MVPEGLDSFNQDGSTVEMIGAEHSPGQEIMSGSLGQGISQAAGIAMEFPEVCLPEGVIRDSILGKIESIVASQQGFPNGSVLVEISYAVETTAWEFTQLLNVIFGNISIKPGIRVEKINLSPSLLRMFKGPRFGREGLRRMLQVSDRPLLFTALKPQGLSAKELAEIAYKFALGGIDIIKDDHGLTNQPFAPFNERVELCTEAVNKANRETGGRAIYVSGQDLIENCRKFSQLV